MKAYQRREAGTATYFKLSAWDPRSFVWTPVRRTFASYGGAMATATKPGRYRISRMGAGDGETGRTDYEPFDVA